MSASRFLPFGCSLFRNHKVHAANPPPLILKSIPQIRRFRIYYSCAAVSSSVTESSNSLHPWPEWVTFVDCLKTRGYLVEPASTVQTDDAGEGGTGDSAEYLYKDIKALKDPCLSFARDRFDIFKSLSRKDVQTVVEGGCPNLFRKVVNSAKRLRASMQLDEGDVCGACNLRGSCDRAYVILKELESTPRTVDIVRILLFYALDPLVISGREKPPGRELIEVSVKNLLSELLELSESTPDLAVPKPSMPSHQNEHSHDEFSRDVEMKKGNWMCPKCGFLNFSRNKMCLKCQVEGPEEVSARDVEMRKGDWNCPQCGFLNFSRNKRCLKCRVDGPKEVGSRDVEMRKGDWNCPQCGFLNFSRNNCCLKCRGKGPEKVGARDVEMKKGDWNCPQCEFMNFARNIKCFRCQESRPKRKLAPGEWECPSCLFFNYRRNMVCLECNFERPKEAPSQYAKGN